MSVYADVTDRHTTARRRGAAATAVLLAIAVLLSGCDQANDPGSSKKDKPRTTTTTTASAGGKPAPHYTVPQLAAKLGCTAKSAGKAKDFRQANCLKDGQNIVLLDFDSAEGQQDWLEYAVSYGGIYLVGDRWVLSGISREYMESLSRTLGGTVREQPDS
jgi:hypothetical protein